MANIFFDTNCFINLYAKKGRLAFSYEHLEAHDLFVSVLTYHIFVYVQKIKIPSDQLKETLNKFNIVEFTEKILFNSMEGPTRDLEDNIQLHSAAEAECDLFLTNDMDLLKIKFFGKTRIASSLSDL